MTSDNPDAEARIEGPRCMTCGLIEDNQYFIVWDCHKEPHEVEGDGNHAFVSPIEGQEATAPADPAERFERGSLAGKCTQCGSYGDLYHLGGRWNLCPYCIVAALRAESEAALIDACDASYMDGYRAAQEESEARIADLEVAWRVREQVQSKRAERAEALGTASESERVELQTLLTTLCKAPTFYRALGYGVENFSEIEPAMQDAGERLARAEARERDLEAAIVDLYTTYDWVGTGSTERGESDRAEFLAEFPAAATAIERAALRSTTGATDA